MAFLLSMIGGAVINAVAFSGSNYLFHQFSSSSDEERKRHDLAIEKYQRNHEKWLRARQARIDADVIRRRKKQQADYFLDQTDKNVNEYARYLSRRATMGLQAEPKLSDYYQPSEKQKDVEIAFITTSLVALGYMIYKFV